MQKWLPNGHQRLIRSLTEIARNKRYKLRFFSQNNKTQGHEAFQKKAILEFSKLCFWNAAKVMGEDKKTGDKNIALC